MFIPSLFARLRIAFWKRQGNVDQLRAMLREWRNDWDDSVYKTAMAAIDELVPGPDEKLAMFNTMLKEHAAANHAVYRHSMAWVLSGLDRLVTERSARLAILATALAGGAQVHLWAIKGLRQHGGEEAASLLSLHLLNRTGYDAEDDKELMRAVDDLIADPRRKAAIYTTVLKSCTRGIRSWAIQGLHDASDVLRRLDDKRAIQPLREILLLPDYPRGWSFDWSLTRKDHLSYIHWSERRIIYDALKQLGDEDAIKRFQLYVSVGHEEVLERLRNRQPAEAKGSLLAANDQASQYWLEGYDFNVVCEPEEYEHWEPDYGSYQGDFPPYVLVSEGKGEYLEIERGVPLG